MAGCCSRSYRPHTSLPAPCTRLLASRVIRLATCCNSATLSPVDGRASHRAERTFAGKRTDWSGLAFGSWSMKFDRIIANGMVVDGTRQSRFLGDVGIREGKIAAIGKLDPADAAEVLDATGLFVAPGFIDLHTGAHGIGAAPKAVEDRLIRHAALTCWRRYAQLRETGRAVPAGPVRHISPAGHRCAANGKQDNSLQPDTEATRDPPR